MNTRKRIVVIITALCTLLAITGCAYFSQLIGSGSSLPTGTFNCSIPVSIQGNKDIVILSFTITSDQKIGSWSIFDFGTRSISIGDGIGQSSLKGNAIQFTLTTGSAGMNITYKINGTIAPPHEMTGSYSFDYGSSYGVVADKFDCDLTPPAAQSTPTP